MPRFQNPGLAQSFADAVKDRLHFPNGTSIIPNGIGPYFVYTPPGETISAYSYQATMSNIDVTFSLESCDVHTYAVATELQSAPGPMPLLGAAAAFDLSRRLRHCVRPTHPYAASTPLLATDGFVQVL